MVSSKKHYPTNGRRAYWHNKTHDSSLFPLKDLKVETHLFQYIFNKIRDSKKKKKLKQQYNSIIYVLSGKGHSGIKSQFAYCLL